MKAPHVLKPSRLERRGVRFRITHVIALGVVGCVTSGCLDPLIEDPGAADHGASPTLTLPGGQGPAGVTPTVPSTTSNPGPGTTPPGPVATATGVVVNPAPTTTQPVAPTPSPVTPPTPNEPVASDAGATPELDGGEGGSDESSDPSSTSPGMDGGLDGGAAAAVQ